MCLGQDFLLHLTVEGTDVFGARIPVPAMVVATHVSPLRPPHLGQKRYFTGKGPHSGDFTKTG